MHLIAQARALYERLGTLGIAYEDAHGVDAHADRLLELWIHAHRRYWRRWRKYGGRG